MPPSLVPGASQDTRKCPCHRLPIGQTGGAYSPVRGAVQTSMATAADPPTAREPTTMIRVPGKIERSGCVQSAKNIVFGVSNQIVAGRCEMFLIVVEEVTTPLTSGHVLPSAVCE